MISCSDARIIKDLEDVSRAFGESGYDASVDVSISDGKITCKAASCEGIAAVEDGFSPRDEIESKRLEKRCAKLALYELMERSREPLPWGALTGVRPLKLARCERDEGRDFEKLYRRLHVSDEKISLAGRVLDFQAEADMGDGEDIFISLPFCPTKCDYCSFVTYPLSVTEKYIPGYVEALCEEIRSFDSYESVKSVYVGGGSPFVLSAEELEKIFKAIREKVPGEVEFTVEAGRPDTFSEEKLKVCEAFGVTRICVNPQTFKDETLKAIGRSHTVSQVYEALEMTSRYPFDVNLDLIAGLAGETGEDLIDSVRKATDTGCANITLHALCLKAGSRLKERESEIVSKGLDEAIERSYEILSEAGYSPYYLYRQKYQAGGLENTGWAKPGKICRYNIGTMEEVGSNVAFGAGAITKRLFSAENRIERLAAPKDIPTYIQKAKEISGKKSELFR